MAQNPGRAPHLARLTAPGLPMAAAPAIALARGSANSSAPAWATNSVWARTWPEARPVVVAAAAPMEAGWRSAWGRES